MLTIIICIVLIIIGSVLLNTWDFDFFGFIILFCSAIYLIVHVTAISLKSYSYEKFVVRRDAFEQTLHAARENGNEYETAAIVKEVAEWNQYLRSQQYDNGTVFFDQYIDDRVMDLEPIE